MARGRYTEASRLAGKYGSANARHTPDRLCTSGLATMIVRSSRAKPFHSTPRYTTAAAAPTATYTRLAFMDPERHPTTGPAMHDAEPARVGAEQGVELLIRPTPPAGEQDMRRAQALEVGTMLGGTRDRERRPPIPVDVERHAGATGVEPH